MRCIQHTARRYMGDKVVSDEVVHFSRMRFYTSYASLHIVLTSIVFAFSSLETGFLYWIFFIMIVLFFFFFYMRMDFVIPWYKLHVRFYSKTPEKKEMSKSAFTCIKGAVWAVTIVWIPLYIILAPSLYPLLKFYVFLWLTFFTFYNSEYLFTSYQAYKEKVLNKKWRLFEKF